MDMRGMLEGLGLGRYADAFLDAGLSAADLRELTESDLQDLGVALGLHRRRILEAIRELPPEGPGRPLPLDRLPSVVAIPLSEYLSATNPVLRLWHACDAVELTLRLVVAVGVADLGSRGPLEGKLAAELARHIEEPTLGRWRRMAQSVVERVARLRDPVAPELATLLNDQLLPLLDGPPGDRRAEASFIALRNQLAHGGGVTQAVAGALLTRWRDRLEAAFSGLQWMQELNLVARVGDDGLGVLRGPQAEAAAADPFGAEVEAALKAAFDRGEAVVLVRGTRVLPLWPLAAYGVPRCSDPEVEPRQPTPQVYVRRGEVRLQLTPVGSDEVCQSEAHESALAAFLEFFRIGEREAAAAEARFRVRGFEAEVHREAARLVGRAEDLERVRGLLDGARQGVLWLTGHAGIGKSCLVARVASELLEDPRGALVLPYRFKRGDDRCSRESFLAFAVERLEAWPPLRDQAEADPLARSRLQPMERLAEALAEVGGERVVVILDGLDELAETDPTFAEDLVVRLQAPGVVWLCAGRPERGLPEAFARPGCRPLFPDGLPPLGAGDVRTMLLEKIGARRKALLLNDTDRGDVVFNAFVERVSELASGLPVYVTYVVGDILSNRFRALDAGERLPPSLDAYHSRLLERCRIGRLSSILTPIAALLAVGRESLDPEALAAILDHWIGFGDGEDPTRLVRSALAAIAPMVRRGSTPERRDGYTLFHHSLREHMEASDDTRGILATARARVGAMATRPGPENGAAEPYLHRHGVHHLLESGRRAEALALLTDLGRLMRRLEVVAGTEGVRGVGEDWRLMGKGGPLGPEEGRWETFWRTREHLLAQGDSRWPNHRVLLQVAADYATSSPVTRAATAWLEGGGCDWVRMGIEERDRPAEAAPSARLFTGFTGEEPLAACALSADGAVAVTATEREEGDGARAMGRLRIWDLGRKVCVFASDRYPSAVGCVALSPCGRWAAAGSRDGVLRVLDVRSRAVVAEASLHDAALEGVSCASEGPVGLSVGRDGRVVGWRFDGTITHETLATADSGLTSLAVDGGGRVAVAGAEDGSVRVLDLARREWRRVIRAHSEGTVTVAVTADGAAAVSGGADGRVCCWDLATGARRWETAAVHDAIGAVALAPGRNLMLTGCSEGPERAEAYDPTVAVRDMATGEVVARLCGHLLDARGVAVSGDGSVAISVGWGAELIAWDLTMIGEPLEQLTELVCVYDLSVTRDGRLAALACEDGAVRLLDVEARSVLASLEGHRDRALHVELSPDERRLLSAGEDGDVRLWRVDTGEPLATLTGHRVPLAGLCWSPDGRYAVSASSSTMWQVGEVRDLTLRVWDLDRQECLRVIDVTGDDLVMRYVHMTPDGRCFAAAETDHALGLWDLRTGRRELRILAEDSRLLGLEIAPDGRTCFTGHEDGTVRRWDLRSGAELGRLETSARSDYARAVACTPDGRSLYVGSYDPALSLYDLESGRLLAAASLNAWVMAAAPLGTTPRCLVAMVDGRVQVVEVVGGPDPGRPWTTVVRPWDRGAPGPVTAACRWCGQRFPPEPAVLDLIRELTRGLDAGASPCRKLDDRAWEEPGLLSACTHCHRPVRFNPFVAASEVEPDLT